MFNLSRIRLDAKGRGLTGERRYTITFKPPMPFAEPTILAGFWSVTMYDGITKLSVQNPINRYSLGSDNDLKENPDGSFTMYLQVDTPGPDKEANWLPAPKGPFYLLLRHYEAVPAAVETIEES
jgi:hypothetical protein